MAQKPKIKSTIHFYKEGNLIDQFNNFIDKETSVTVEAEDSEPTPPKSPEQLLFLAVVYQALLDATKEKRYNDSEEVKRYRREATNWFTVEYGTTATDFEEVCFLAGLEPRSTRSFAQRIFTKEIKFERKRINVLINSSDDKNVL